jgi:hypothetical protein
VSVSSRPGDALHNWLNSGSEGNEEPWPWLWARVWKLRLLCVDAETVMRLQNLVCFATQNADSTGAERAARSMRELRQRKGSCEQAALAPRR